MTLKNSGTASHISAQYCNMNEIKGPSKFAVRAAASFSNSRRTQNCTSCIIELRIYWTIRLILSTDYRLTDAKVEPFYNEAEKDAE